MVILASVRELDAKYLDRFLESVAKTRDVAIETLAGYRQVVLGFIQNHHHRLEVWGAHQAYIALGQLMATAAYLGIDACPMEGIDASKYDALLGLQDSPYATRVACALGYRHPEDRYAQQSKVRFDVEEVIHRI